MMKEIRLHGRGCQGVVKASQIVVKAAVAGQSQGQFIPFFGVERKGSPVFGYLRISEEPIRRKMQVYEPDILLIMDDSLVSLPETYAGLKEGGTVIINSVKSEEELKLPAQTEKFATIDATGIAEKYLGRNIPNTAMLGAFARVSELVDRDILFQEIENAFGEANKKAAVEAYGQVAYIERQGV